MRVRLLSFSGKKTPAVAMLHKAISKEPTYDAPCGIGALLWKVSLFQTQTKKTGTIYHMLQML